MSDPYRGGEQKPVRKKAERSSMGRTRGQSTLARRAQLWHSAYDISFGALLGQYEIKRVDQELLEQIAGWAAVAANEAVKVIETYLKKEVDDRWEDASYEDFEP